MNLDNYEKFVEYIIKLPLQKNYNLTNIIKVLDLLGNPQNNYKIIHVAGSNGKGSTCSMIYSILNQAGYNVGKFTKPHLVDIRERFVTKSGNMSKNDFLRIGNTILSHGIKLRFFEICVIIAFMYFSEQKCDYVVLEVGVGGLTDPTNIISPIVTTITNISLEHVAFLGPTLDDIAFQKAGIIKPGIPVFLNFHNEVIENVAKEKGSSIIFTDKKIPTNMIGDYQQKNAALAYEVCKYLEIPENIILQGLQKVEHNGRLQYLTQNLLIDGAHNEEGLNSLKIYLEEKKCNIVYCISTKKGKNVRTLLVPIFGEDKKYYLVDGKNNMLEVIEKIQKDMSGLDYEVKKSNEIKDLAHKNPNTLYVVFGSLYMIGEFYEK